MLHQCKICCLSVAIWRGQVRSCDSKRVDYRGQFLAGCTKGWCNVTALSGSCMLIGEIRGFNYQLCSAAGLETTSEVVTLLLQSDTGSLWPPLVWWIFPIRGKLEQREPVTEWKGGKEQEGGRGGLWWYFPACSLILKHRCSLHAALSAFEHTPPRPPCCKVFVHLILH